MKVAARVAAQAIGVVLAFMILAALRDVGSQKKRNEERSPQNDLAQVHEEIDRQNDLLVQALCAGDSIAYSLLFAPNAVSLPGNGSMLRGRHAIAEMIHDTFQTVAYLRAEVETTDLMLEGDIAYEMGMFDFDLLVKRKKKSSKGRYILVWQKINDRWLILRDVGQPGAPVS
ncbi:MAG: nuclear transport factor 2 family protein [Candidatus Eremiobacteraeota bacterium]|nr:nuclear transport factor 2 family protein [Candidatus Eremiobacteraeota bacterium]